MLDQGGTSQDGNTKFQSSLRRGSRGKFLFLVAFLPKKAIFREWLFFEFTINFIDFFKILQKRENGLDQVGISLEENTKFQPSLHKG